MKPIIVIVILSVVLLVIISTVLALIFIPKSSNSCGCNSKLESNKSTHNYSIDDIITGERLLKTISKHNVLYGKYETVIDKLNDNPGKHTTVITHQSDNVISNNLLKQFSVKHWFGCNAINDMDSITCLPLGIADKRWPHGDLNTLFKVMLENNEKSKLCYLNIKVSTNYEKRQEVVNHFSGVDWVTQGSRSNYEDYLRELSCHKYAFSPEGNGPDTHRAWECLYLGVIPIITRSTHQQICFTDLPIMVVDNWSEVNQTELKDTYVLPQLYHEKLTLSYWDKLISSILGSL